MTEPSGFSKLVPGFEFLQELAKGTGSSMPGMGGFGQWVAPTLDPAEIGKRIDELKTVQFWLEQNARMLATTIQALEVQRMTLSTLKTMNVQLGAMGKSADKPAADPAAKGKTKAAGAGSVVDPVEWWSALTRQFTQLAAGALATQPVPAAPPATAAKTAKAGSKGGPRKRSDADR